MSETLERRERLYHSIKNVHDEHTRKVLYSQFIDEYYKEAFDAILEEFKNGRVQRVTRTERI